MHVYTLRSSQTTSTTYSFFQRVLLASAARGEVRSDRSATPQSITVRVIRCNYSVTQTKINICWMRMSFNEQFVVMLWNGHRRVTPAFNALVNSQRSPRGNTAHSVNIFFTYRRCKNEIRADLFKEYATWLIWWHIFNSWNDILWSQINNQTGNPMNVSVQMWMVTNPTVTKYPIEMDGWMNKWIDG